MLIAVVGKPNCGKSTLFSAATLVDVEISNRVFTTIQPNKGVTYVRTECPCKQLSITCDPKNSKCINGTRYVPVKIIDIAGLVPDAHLGKGLGNQFLSDIMEAQALIHIIDLSGGTDENGNVVAAGIYDPKNDIKFLEEEIDYWILDIIKRNLPTLSRRAETTKERFSELIHKQLTGLGIKLNEVEEAIAKTEITLNSDEYEMLKFIKLLREKSKPIIIAGNKIDVSAAEKNFERLKDLGYSIIPCSAESELALRRAAEKGIINYNPGDGNFEIIKEIDTAHKKALDFICSHVLDVYGSTGVQKVIDKAVFDILKMIVVYPVENEHKFTDKKSNVLPDAFLMKKGSTAHDLAYAVHEEIGKKFIAAIDAKTGKQLSGSYILKNNDVISIKAGK